MDTGFALLQVRCPRVVNTVSRTFLAWTPHSRDVREILGTFRWLTTSCFRTTATFQRWLSTTKPSLGVGVNWCVGHWELTHRFAGVVASTWWLSVWQMAMTLLRWWRRWVFLQFLYLWESETARGQWYKLCIWGLRLARVKMSTWKGAFKKWKIVWF